MSEQKNISKDLLLRFLRGEASAEEQRYVREAAKEDPFIADAIEGLEGWSDAPSKMDNVMARLDGAVEERAGWSGGKTIQLSPMFWRVSAVAALLVIVVGSFFLFQQIQDSSPVAEAEVPEYETTDEVEERSEPAESTETVSSSADSSAVAIDVPNSGITYSWTDSIANNGIAIIEEEEVEEDQLLAQEQEELLEKSIEGNQRNDLQFAITYGASEQKTNNYWYTASPYSPEEGIAGFVSWTEASERMTNENYLALAFEPDPIIEEIAAEEEADLDDLEIAEADEMEAEPAADEMIAGAIEMDSEISNDRDALLGGGTYQLEVEAGRVWGFVRDSETGDPLVGATVVGSEGQGGVADANGYYELPASAGQETVTVEYLGYKSYTGEITVFDGRSSNLDIGLVQNMSEMSEVVVASKSLDNQSSAYDEYFAGNFKTAASRFNEEVKKDPNDMEAYYYLGLSNFNSNKFNKAIDAFDIIINNGDNLYTDGAIWYKSQALLKKGKTTEATTLLKELSSRENSYQEGAEKMLLDLDE